MTKAGRFMYSMTMKAESFFEKKEWLWWILNLTWGFALTFISAFIALFVRIAFKCKPSRFHQEICFKFGSNWGGLEGGIFIFVAGNVPDDFCLHTKQHELGHSFQNALLGPFCILLSTIPSIIRYWILRLTKSSKDYDAVWFEKSATDAGKAYDEHCKKDN